MITDFRSIEPSSLPFANDVLERFDSNIYETLETRLDSVDLSKVLGTIHGKYQGHTWGEIMPVGPWYSFPGEDDIPPGMLQRAHLYLPYLQNNPDYYLQRGVRDGLPWRFFQLGEAFYIDNGNNRTVIGRVFLTVNNLPPIVHDVKVTELVPRIS